MRYRLLDLLACEKCKGMLLVNADEIIATEFSGTGPFGFSCTYFCSRFNKKNPHISWQECRVCYKMQINRGSLVCGKCNASYEILQGIPDFAKPQPSPDGINKNDLMKITADTYSLLWTKAKECGEIPGYHYDKMQEVIPEGIVKGKLGLEVGCGCGLDTRIMARENPFVEIVALDISEGVYRAGRLNRNSVNVHIIRSSSLSIPLRDGLFDFCYSFGVAHHTPDPGLCFSEMGRVLKQNGKVSLYVYEDHQDNIWKRYPLQLVGLVRRITSRIDRRLLYLLCVAASPSIFAFFTIPARIASRFSKTRKLASQIPFNFGKGPFSLQGDLFDRFGAPVELRFSRMQLSGMLEKSGFKDVRFTGLRTSAGIVAWANKR